MLSFLWRIPAFFVWLVWSLFFPAKPQPRPVTPPSEPEPGAPSDQSIEEGHEVSDTSPKLVAFFVVGLFGVIFLSMAALGAMYVHLYAKTGAIPVRPIQQTFRNAPRDKTSIAKDWDAIDAAMRQRLDHYGWADRAHGVVRVPIARAMALVAAEGLPARPGQPPDFGPPEQEKLPLMQLETNPDATKFDPH